MIKNNLEIDVNVKFMEEGLTQARHAEKVGTFAPYFNRIIKNPEDDVNKTFINVMEQLGYNIELTYIMKEV